MKKVSSVYYFLHSKDDLLLSKWLAWNIKSEQLLEYDEYVSLFRNINKLTVCTKLRSFQYKFLLRAIVTNVDLKYNGIRQDANCTFCNLEKETIQHLFVNCIYVKPLWQFVKKIINNTLK